MICDGSSKGNEAPPIKNTKSKGKGPVVTGTPAKTAPAKMNATNKRGTGGKLEGVKKTLYMDKPSGGKDVTIKAIKGGNQLDGDKKNKYEKKKPPFGRGGGVNTPAWMGKGENRLTGTTDTLESQKKEEVPLNMDTTETDIGDTKGRIRGIKPPTPMEST